MNRVFFAKLIQLLKYKSWCPKLLENVSLQTEFQNFPGGHAPGPPLKLGPPGLISALWPELPVITFRPSDQKTTENPDSWSWEHVLPIKTWLQSSHSPEWKLYIKGLSEAIWTKCHKENLHFRVRNFAK